MISFILEPNPILFPFIFSLSLLTFGLGVFVMKKARQPQVGALFFAYCFFASFWSLSHAFMSLSPNPEVAVIAAYGSVLAALPIPLVFLLLCSVFPDKEIPFSRFQLELLFLPSIVLILFFFSGDLIQASAKENQLFVKLGGANILYMLHILAYTIIGLIKVLKNYYKASTLEKIRFRYFFISLLITGVVGYALSEFFLLFGIFKFVYLGPFGTSSLVFLTTYAILKYRIMDVSIAIKKTTAYSLVTTGITFTYVIVVMGFSYLWRLMMGTDSFWPVLPASLMISVTFIPLRSYFQEITDRLFFRRSLEYQKILKEITRMIVSVTDLHVLFRLIDRTIVRVMCLKSASVLLLEEKEGLFIVEKTTGLSEAVKRIKLELDNPLVQYLYEKKDVVVLDELRTSLRTEKLDIPGKEKLLKIMIEMENFSATVSVPSFLKGKLVGILNLGEKLSGEPYTPDDLELLFTLASEASVAIENAKLYRDITETRDYLNNLIQGSEDAIVTLDLDGKVLSWNDGAKRMFGYEAAEVIGRSLQSINEKDFREKLERITAGEGLKAYETMAKNKKGVEVPLLLSASPVRDSDGAIVRVFVIIKDITELKKVEKLKDEFITTVSHELRTPLTTINEGISLLSDQILGPVSKEQGKMLVSIKTNISRLTRLVLELLDISKIDSGKIAIKNESFDLGAAIFQVVNDFKLQAKEKQLELRTNFPSQKIKIFGDKDKIIRIFINLISNSLKFTPNGFIEVSIKELENEFECAVVDSGIGISKENLKLLFRKFQQFGRTPGPGAKGTGLGLSIVRGLVEALQGKVWAESELGQGTKITFTLPKHH
ncbi:MAG: ATP-binding protein [bacterium]